MQQGPINVSIILKNTGDNNIDYNFQESSNGTTWYDISGSDGTLTPSGLQQVTQTTLSSSLAMIRLFASGDSTLEFSMSRYASRAEYAALPILSL